MFENQPPSLSTGNVANGQTAGGVVLMAAAGNSKAQVWIDTIYLGAAGYVQIQGDATQLSVKHRTSAAGHIYVGLPFEAANNANMTANATLDSASVGATPIEINFRKGTKTLTPGVQ